MNLKKKTRSIKYQISPWIALTAAVDGPCVCPTLTILRQICLGPGPHVLLHAPDCKLEFRSSSPEIKSIGI